MDDTTQERFRALIAERLRDLGADDARGQDGQAVVTLDQQSVGRLSRMDALQSQAMARAAQARRDVQRARLQAALQRLAAGEYGDCEECGEPIAPTRLTLDPAVQRCIGCAAG